MLGLAEVAEAFWVLVAVEEVLGAVRCVIAGVVPARPLPGPLSRN